MTNDNDEEKLLLDKLLSARHAIELNKNAKRELAMNGNRLEKDLAEIEQAWVDYMLSNGLRETEVGHLKLTIGESFSVDVDDINAVPDEFVREKIVREPNKILIRELHKSGKLEGANWYSIKESHKLTVTGV